MPYSTYLKVSLHLNKKVIKCEEHALVTTRVGVIVHFVG